MHSARPPHRKISTLAALDKGSLQQQLAQAHHQIALLKDQNALLTIQLQQQHHYRTLYEQQEQTIRLLKEELAFRQQQQVSMQSIISNYEEINAQLTAKVQTLPCKSLPTTAQPLQEAESFLNELPATRRFRGSRLGSSCSQERKQNHNLTPKSRVRWDVSLTLEEECVGKKKVFL